MSGHPLRYPDRCDGAVLAGGIEGRAVWLRILAAVEELIAMEPPGPVH